ncbi:hypothetical protein PCE1_004302 [Barthelona sp. PCE]
MDISAFNSFDLFPKIPEDVPDEAPAILPEKKVSGFSEKVIEENPLEGIRAVKNEHIRNFLRVLRLTSSSVLKSELNDQRLTDINDVLLDLRGSIMQTEDHIQNLRLLEARSNLVELEKAKKAEIQQGIEDLKEALE